MGTRMGRGSRARANRPFVTDKSRPPLHWRSSKPWFQAAEEGKHVVRCKNELTKTFERDQGWFPLKKRFFPLWHLPPAKNKKVKNKRFMCKNRSLVMFFNNKWEGVFMNMRKGVLGWAWSSNGWSFHPSSMRWLFMMVFPSQPVLLLQSCFVFVLDIGKNVFPTYSHAKDPLMMPCPTQPLPDALRVLRMHFPHYLWLYLFGIKLATFAPAQNWDGF